MEKYLYRPKNCFFGDCMPFYNRHDNLFYLYFQKDTRNPVPFGEPFGWELDTTSDFVHYKEYGEVLKKGSEEDHDEFVYAGSVFEQNNNIRAFYTGYNRNFVNKSCSSQVLMKASSKDGIHWYKDGLAKELSPQTGYDSDNWRDPSIVWNPDNQEYILILGTRLVSDLKAKTGRLVYYTSKNSQDWTFKGDFWTPNLYTMIEMPQIFKIKDWWYLVYSEYDLNKTTHYVMSKKITGPWLFPKQDTFNGRAYYAARTASDEKNRYLFGWVPSKEAGKDENNYLWGGTFLPLKITQNNDGSLKTSIPDTLIKTVSERYSFESQKIKSKYKRTETQLQGNQPKKHYLLKNKIEYEPGTKSFSLIFFENSDTKEGYEFNIDLNKQQLSVRRTPNLRWYQMLNIGLSRQVNLVPNKEYDISLLIDDTIAVIEIAGVVLSCRVQKNTCYGLSFAVVDGIVQIKSV